MSDSANLPRTLKLLVDERLDAQRRVAQGIDSEIGPEAPYFGGPGGGDDYDLGGVTSLSVPGGDGLQGDVDIAGGEGFVASQQAPTIILAPPRLRHCANPRTPLALSMLGSLAARSIYLHPMALAGSMLVTAFYIRVQRVGNPSDITPLIEAAVYRRNDADNGFAREAHFGTASFTSLSQVATGETYRRGLSASVLLPMGQHYLAFLYKYLGGGSYDFGICDAVNAHHPGSGIYKSGVAIELPASLADSDLSVECTGLVWAELAAD